MWWYKFLATTVLGGLLIGCGFQVRGTAEFPEGMSVIYINTGDRYSVFYRHLTTTFKHAGLTVTEDPTQADTEFRISRDETGQRVLSVNVRNVPVEYDVFYTVSYSVYMNNEQILAPQQLTRTRDYTYDVTEVLGKAQEEDVLRESLAEDLVNSVTRRMGSVE
jgi:LPS-assembly lipoprotein